jgi:hypothetical protein
MSDSDEFTETSTVGVQGEDGKVEACLVRVAQRLPANTDTVHVYTFDQFIVKSADDSVNVNLNDCETQEESSCSLLGQDLSLSKWMQRVKPLVEAGDSGDEDEIYSLSERTLMKLHDLFIPIVRQAILEHGFYASGLIDYNLENLQIKKYAKPNYRKATDQYAQYLHNDAWIACTTEDEANNEAPATVAMVNVWFVLNDRPHSNTLVFWETNSVDTVRASHMLHAHPVHTRHQTVAYDGDMAWGRFYVFVAGQRQDTLAKLLLHGALSLSKDVSNDSNEYEKIRRSVEMRYLLHAPKR